MENILAAATGTCAETKPNFLIIGAAKSGTTALWHSLRRHPQIYMSSRKHTRFFAYDAEDPEFQGPALEAEASPYSIKDVDAYHALFAGVGDETAIGEASHSYLYRPEAPGRIREYASGMKLIAMLRDPAERAFSHYRQMVRDRREHIPDFVRALEAEEGRVRDGWWPDFRYVGMGLYHDQLKRYFDLFEHDQIRVHLYEDFESNPQEVLRDIFRFLNVDTTHLPETAIRYNASGIPRSGIVHALLQKARLAKPAMERLLPEEQARRVLRAGSALHNRNLNRAKLSSQTRRTVTERYFADDILKLEGVIQRDLSAWRR